MASYPPGFVNLLTSQTGEYSSPGFENLSGSQSESKHTELKTVLEMKDKLNKRGSLEKLLEKPEPLSEMELSLKIKLMSKC
ncbi:hypothetical protein Bca4012_057512 [Brassica carinata]